MSSWLMLSAACLLSPVFNSTILLIIQKIQKTISYCNHKVNVIRYDLAQSDHIKRRLIKQKKKILNETFSLKNVILVSRSTVAFRSCSRSGDDAGKLFLYMFRSIRSELWRVSKSLMNFSFCKVESRFKNKSKDNN